MNPEKYNPNDILNLYAKNSVNGEHNLKEGKVVNVPSKENWGRVIRDEEHIALYLDENSKKEIYDRIISPVSEIANKYNIELWLAGNTYPIHVTLVSGYLKGLKKKEREELYKKIESDEIFLNAIKKIQKPIEVDYKYLLLNGDNITLNAVDIPDSVVSFRRSMTTLFDKYLVPIRARDNILHMTIARIKKIPKNDTLENNLTEFIKELRNIRHEVSRKPIKTLTSEVFVGTNMIDIPEYPEE